VVQGQEYRGQAHPTRKTCTEQPYRTLQQELSTRSVERLPVRITVTGKGIDRTMGGTLQWKKAP